MNSDWHKWAVLSAKKSKMGWFSSDEVVTVNAQDTVQTVALGILALVALGYGVVKIFNAHHRSQAERVANQAVRIQTVTASRCWIKKISMTIKTIKVIKSKNNMMQKQIKWKKRQFKTSDAEKKKNYKWSDTKFLL